MNNLHWELAPVSDGAWGQIEAEARRTFARNVAGRRAVDVVGPAGPTLSAVGSGHIRELALAEGVSVHQREVQSVIELRAPFSVTRQAVDDVERGATDSDWQPVKDAAKQIALAEDRTIVAQALSALRLAGVDGPYSLLLSADLYTAVAETSSERRARNVTGRVV